MGADQNRLAHRRRLDQVLTAERQQAAADESDVAGGGVGEHLSHAVAQHHLGFRGDGFVCRAALKPDAALGQHLGHLLEALRMARHDDDEQVGDADSGKRFHDQRFLAFPGAGGEEYRACSPEPFAQVFPQADRAWRYFHIEFQVAGNFHRRCAQFDQPACIRPGLGGNRRQGLQAVAAESLEAAIFARRFFRHPRVDQQQRYPGFLAGLHQVEPDFGFHQQPDFGLEVAEKALHRKREVVGQVALQHTVAEQLPAGFPTGGGHVGEQDAVPGIACLQLGN